MAQVTIINGAIGSFLEPLDSTVMVCVCVETVVGIGTNGHEALNPGGAERMAGYLDNGASFSDWSVGWP